VFIYVAQKGQEIDYVCEWVSQPAFRSTPAPPIGSYRRRLAASPGEQATGSNYALAAAQQLLPQRQAPGVTLQFLTHR